MASFSEHCNQATRNLRFLEQANQFSADSWDWQVTVAFYVAVHLINAHLASKSGASYRSHEQVNQAINPYSPLSPTKLSEPEYLAYAKLQGLARRARYLCNEDHANRAAHAHFTYDKHFARSMRNLDVLLAFMQREYGQGFPVVAVKCLELRPGSLAHVTVK